MALSLGRGEGSGEEHGGLVDGAVALPGVCHGVQGRFEVEDVEGGGAEAGEGGGEPLAPELLVAAGGGGPAAFGFQVGEVGGDEAVEGSGRAAGFGDETGEGQGGVVGVASDGAPAAVGAASGGDLPDPGADFSF